MDTIDRERFGTAIAAMASTLRQEVTPAMIQGYWWGLKDLAIEQVEAAIANALRRCKFMPSAAELRELAGVVSDSDAALLAWGTLERAIREHGAYKTVDFEDKAINAAVRNLGGWERLCSLAPDEFDKWLRKDFLAVYASLRRTGVPPGASLPLGGIHDRENQMAGYGPQRAPLLIPSDKPAQPLIGNQGRKAIPA